MTNTTKAVLGWTLIVIILASFVVAIFLLITTKEEKPVTKPTPTPTTCVEVKEKPATLPKTGEDL